MDKLKEFKQFCDLIINRPATLNQFKMVHIVETLLPAYRYGRSASAPRATKYLYDGKNHRIKSAGTNGEIGLKILEVYADSDCKRSIIASIKLGNHINNLLIFSFKTSTKHYL